MMLKNMKIRKTCNNYELEILNINGLDHSRKIHHMLNDEPFDYKDYEGVSYD